VLVRSIRAVGAVSALLASLLAGPLAGPASAVPALAPTPVATPTPEPPLPGQGPGGQAVGGARMGTIGLALPSRARPLPKDISAHGWVIADLDTGEVLAARNPHGRYPPASTLKWLTALTLLPQLDKHKRVTCTYADVDVDGTRVGLVEHGRYTVDLLFQAMLMASGNDAANALARVAGSVPSTVAAMNATAREIQAYDTHAATPSGLDGPKQLTSAYDLALIARADLARADFRKYTAQRLGTIPAQSARYRAFQFANDNRLLYNYPGAFGGKNGFTDAAHHSFIGAAKHGNRRLIVTMMYGEHKPDNISVQAGRLLDWGFALPRRAAPVGTLVPPAAANSTPSGSASPSPSPSATDAAARPDTAGSGSATPAIAMLGVAALAVLLLALTTRLLRRRSRF
jgi:serine-type D-Ala-D-Ala carboxypeptidase (penicillin-binding protein 5/6)